MSTFFSEYELNEVNLFVELALKMLSKYQLFNGAKQKDFFWIFIFVSINVRNNCHLPNIHADSTFAVSGLL